MCPAPTDPDSPIASPRPSARAPLAELWMVAWPSILTMTSYTLMQFVDSFMVSRVEGSGPLLVAAQGNAGMFAWMLMALCAGLTSVVSAFVSQHVGANSPREGPRYVWAGLMLSMIYWVVILLPAAAMAPMLFRLIGHSPELTQLEVSYARILLVGGIISMSSRVLGHFFYGIHRPRIVFAGAMAGNLVNVLGNYLLIYGHAGFPALGLAGAALGTVAGSCVEMLFPLAVYLSRRIHAEFGTRSAHKWHWPSMGAILRLGWPAGLQFGSEMICWYIFMAALVGHFGEDHMTAGWATMRYCTLSFMPALGISNALTAIVGRYMGASDPATASARALLGVKAAMVYMGCCAVIFVLLRRAMIGVFLDPQLPPEVRNHIIDIGSRLLICAAFFQLFDALGVTLIGALRGAGDTIGPGVLTVVLSWTIIVGGGLGLVYFAPGLQSLGPWIAAAAYVVVLGICLAWRWRHGRWREIRLVEIAPRAAELVNP